MPLHRAYVGMGSNLGDREGSLRAALAALESLPELRVAAVSRVRETEPVGLLDQPRFLNAVAALDTTLGPRALLEALLAVERGLGRTREGPRFGPRPIDLDLLLHDGTTVDEPGLQVPHPRMHERRFVLEPLVELDPDAEIPGRGTASAVLAHLDSVA